MRTELYACAAAAGSEVSSGCACADCLVQLLLLHWVGCKNIFDILFA
jgi:hypothetical protein